jgi:Tfp pilus assembly PilM family ATPase
VAEKRVASPLKGWNVLALRRKFGVRPQGPITALDVDGQVLRAVQIASPGSRTAVTRIEAVRLDLAADADRSDPVVMGGAIARALKHLRLKPGLVVMGVPRTSVVLRTLSLPVLKDIRELASLVHFQVGKDLPFRTEDAVIDFKVRRTVPAAPRIEPGGKPAEGSDESKAEPPAAPPKLEVLVTAVKRDVVEFYENTAAEAGLKLAALGWLSYGNARCVEACRVTEGDEAVALVSLRPDEVIIDIIAQQSLLFSRGAAIRLQPAEPALASAKPEPGALGVSPKPQPDEVGRALTSVATAGAAESVSLSAEAGATTVPTVPPPEKNETFADAVTIEVVRSLHSYSGMEPHDPVAKAVVVGATGHEPAVVDAIQKRLNTPCSLLDLASTLGLPPAAREHASGAISAIGLALGVNDPSGLPFDFLHPKRPAVQRDLGRIRLLAGAAAVAALLMLLMAVRTHLVNQRTRLLQQVDLELAEAKKKQPIYRQMRTQAGTLSAWVGESRNWLQHYAYLTAILPPSEEVYLKSLSISGQGTIRLAVQARSGEILAKLDKQLRAAGYDVKPLAITPGADKFGYNFASTVELLVPDKMKIDLAKVQPPSRPEDDISLEPRRPGTRKGGGG